MLAALSDLWDVNISGWEQDFGTLRITKEGFQEAYIAIVKCVVKKPVVGVGRFTSPDTMLSQVTPGIVGFVGCACPSIADPFLPKKIEEGRLDDIRECIGCNNSVTGQNLQAPMRRTQDPAVGEEWRRRWHSERIVPRSRKTACLSSASGP
jgi:dimethylamine/trimethylamine dehydrogenase